MKRPLLAITLGDIAGIGPEIVVRAWPKLFETARPVVLGDHATLALALQRLQAPLELQPITELSQAAPDVERMPVLQATTRDLREVRLGTISAVSGGAAYDFLIQGIDLALQKQIQGLVTCPLHKEGLHAAGISEPGHTEILAHRTGAAKHAMLLYDDQLPLAVAHVTLHQSLRSIFDGISTDSILDKIELLHGLLPRLIGQVPRIGVCALNPHAGDGGLFGDEESRLIRPAVANAQERGILVSGPWPADAIFLAQNRVKFDGIVAMFHDQGHIAMKLLGGRRAVNITAGLPIVRTSVAHGTAYDIAGRGVADASSLVAAVKVAAKLANAGV